MSLEEDEVEVVVEGEGRYDVEGDAGGGEEGAGEVETGYDGYVGVPAEEVEVVAVEVGGGVEVGHVHCCLCVI